MEKLLGALNGEEDRTARFQCVACFVRTADDPDPSIATGTWEGHIARVPSGDGGFGYDPVFVDATSGMTAAELAADTKNARSHRGQAIRLLREQLPGV